jgi:SAM-dependent methyltransferase
MSQVEAYADRHAAEYEQIYHREDPVRQAELAAMSYIVTQAMAFRRVLEIACGTGYWTALLAPVAEHITGVDASEAMLAIARQKQLPADKIELRSGDAYALDEVEGDFDAALANFWLSHVPRSRLNSFLEGLHARLGSGAVVFMADNTYIPGIGGELLSKPGTNDTYKVRRLADGTQYDVLKNYFTRQELTDLFAPRARDLDIHMGECYWWLSYTVR